MERARRSRKFWGWQEGKKSASLSVISFMNPVSAIIRQDPPSMLEHRAKEGELTINTEFLFLY